MRNSRTRVVAILSALTLVGSLSIGATSSVASSLDKGTVTVWIQGDAKSWPAAVDRANSMFNSKYPNVKVDIQYQTWGDSLKKLDAALVAGNAPDVFEFGNTQVLKYSAAGALKDLSASRAQFAYSTNWLKGLEDAGTYDGKLFAVPYYAGSRAVMYRTDLFASLKIKAPKTYDQFLAAADKLMAANSSNSKFSAVYMPGKYWYAAMGFVYDSKGAIAVKENGKWKGSLDSAASLEGLNRWKTIVDKYSKADKSGDEGGQWEVFAGGNVAMSYSNGWETCCISPQKGAFFTMPSIRAGEYMPAFLGGSNLGVPAKAKNPDWGTYWIKSFTSGLAMREIVKVGNLPNNTSMLTLVKGGNAPVAKGATSSWFVPTAEKWVNVENANVLQTMLSDIATGKKTVAVAAKDASAEITKLLN
jgi:N,N'-diacetylchitobiose transport system substrate-binding protein